MSSGSCPKEEMSNKVSHDDEKLFIQIYINRQAEAGKFRHTIVELIWVH
jgi:hypothetical protein